MTCFSYTNGKFIPSYKARISINDRSVHFSDAVYEVVTVYNYRMLFWKYHIDRLKNSLNAIDIKFNMNFQSLLIKCEELIKKNNLKEGIIYIHISRGIAKRNHNWSNKICPSLIISCSHKKTYNINAKKIALISHKDIRWDNCHIKTVSLLPNVLLKQKALKKNALECLMLDEQGYVTEATTSNIWILKNNTLITTPLTSNILPGVTRKILIELANILNIKVREDKFKESDVYKADNVFITNSSSIILEANKLNGKKLKVSNNQILKNIKSEILKVINHE
jgi:D-alanine transaminase